MKPVILLVDDNKQILHFLAEDLGGEYEVLQAKNGREAVDQLNNESIQLVISDVMMPVMNGFELCKFIKSNFDYCHIPVILLTAKNTLRSKIEGLELGADAYIEKPFSPEHLTVQIVNLLTNRNKIKEYFAKSPLIHIKSMAHSKADDKFLETLNNHVEANLDNTELDVNDLAKLMNMSRPTLFRKIKAVSNLTLNELINITRLKKGAQLLAEGDFKINEIAVMVGFSSQTNFGRSFHKQFGMSPSDYIKTKREVPDG